MLRPLLRAVFLSPAPGPRATPQLSAPSAPSRLLRHWPRLAPVALLALAGGGWSLHGPQSTLAHEGPVARMQYDVWMVSVWVVLFIFVGVGGVLAYAQWRFRARAADADGAVPEQTHGNPLVELGLIILSIALLVIIAVPTVRGIYTMDTLPEPERACHITATGYQWWFKFEYTDEGVSAANEMVIPVGRPVKVTLRTSDVIHSFWVPRLAGKIDMIPNRPNWMWLQADKPGYYWGQCAEFCGSSHAYMRFRVIALPEPEYAAWVARQKEPARADAAAACPADLPPAASVSADADAVIGAQWARWQARQNAAGAPADAALTARGRRLFAEMGCAGCHTVRGHEGAGLAAPDLTHLASRSTLAAGVLDNNAENLRRWIRHPEQVKAGNLMWAGVQVAPGVRMDGYKDNPRLARMTEAEAEALVAYLQSLH